MRIEDYIPYGRENAISYDELILETGLNSRQIRMEIAKSDATILNLQDGRGFFRFDPTSTMERSFARKYSAQEKARGWSCIKKAMKVDRLLNRTEPNVFNGNLYRLARLLKGDDEETVADAIGMSARRLKRAETGSQELRDDEIEKLEEYYGVGLRYETQI